MKITKFKEGDRIRRTERPRSWVPMGYITTVLKATAHGYKYEDNEGAVLYVVDEHWELVEDSSKHHIHHDLIIAWAKGARIGYTAYNGTEQEMKGTPSWSPVTKYHIMESPLQTDAERIIELEAKVYELENPNG